MRKSVGFILLTLLSLPALAFAWTAGITVQGPAGGMSTNFVTANGVTVSGGTSYVYNIPAGPLSATVATGAGYSAVVTLNGATVTPVAGVVSVPQAAIQNLKVVYTVAKSDVAVQQSVGGKVYVKIGNATSAVGFKGITAGTTVNVMAIANAGYVLASTVPASGSFVAPGPATVSAVFTSVDNVKAAVSAPPTASAGSEITVLASGASNAGAIAYAFAVAPAAPNSTAGNVFKFTPAAAGTYVVTLTATAGGATDTQTASITVNTVNSSANAACTQCHASSTPAVVAAYTTGSPAHGTSAYNAVKPTCEACHTTAPHAANSGGCIGCHSIPQNGAAFSANALVDDNNGVRAITAEFGKWSHHVTGVDLQNQHCAVCHLEGKFVNGRVVADETKHMVDNQVHLRNADTDADMLWNPAAPNFTTMDNFCMTCHDSDGATSDTIANIMATATPAVGKTFSPSNPFADTISNQYDKFERPAVVDAKSQFNTGNNSHHAVLGKRYTGRTRTGATRLVAATFANNSGTTAGKLPGVRTTIYDAGRFEPTYVTLANDGGETGTRNGGSTLGDDSTLHCGDCHTVGQYRAADVNVAPFNKAVIGAHGSNNEYLLRNYAGTDVRHIGQNLDASAKYISTGNYLVCFNCHAITKYGNGQGHDGERGGSEQCNGPYNTRSEPTGISNKVSSLTPVVNPPYTGVGEDRLMSVVTQIGGTTGGAYGAQTTGHGGMLGNIYGIQCANCHNSGVDNGYGGIHGSTVQTYKDGLGNTTKHFRFLAGLGNALFVPGTNGGYVGGTAATYKVYSSNRTTPASYTQLPIRNAAFAFSKYSAVSAADRQKIGYKPTTKLGSFTYTTGGVTNDLNWEQKTSGSDIGAISATQGVSGCYTLQVKGLINSHGGLSLLQSAGYPADDIRYAPGDGLEAVDGKEVLDNWGGCEDHGGVAAASSEPFIRGIVRPVTY